MLYKINLKYLNYKLLIISCILLFNCLTISYAQELNIPKSSTVKNLVSAQDIEQQGQLNYNKIILEAKQKNTLLGQEDVDFLRVNKIAQNLIKQANNYNVRAKNWQWEVNLIKSDMANAFCLPSGKIAVYTGIIKKLNLTDDEIAIVLGHEMAHATQEHAREQLAKNKLASMGAGLVSSMFNLGNVANLALNASLNLVSLKFSRDDESDADIVGLNISTHAGYDPRASIVLWQKMAKLSANNPPQWLSTHPIGKNRIANLQLHIPKLMPIFTRLKPELAKHKYATK